MQPLPISATVPFLLSAALSFGCTTTLPQHLPTPGAPEEGLSPSSGLAYGRFKIDIGTARPVGLRPSTNHAHILWRNEVTGERFSHPLHHSGSFFWNLPGGRYEITDIWMGFNNLSFVKGNSIRFRVVPGRAVYLGTLSYRPQVVDQHGALDILDEFETEQRQLKQRYPTFSKKAPPLKGLMFILPPEEWGSKFLDIILNNQVLEPFLLDTGATHTVITTRTARTLGITDWTLFPSMDFFTSSGTITSPLSQVDSIRVGTHVMQDVEVAIDVDDHLPYGLLGMNFLQHFHVVLDQKGQQAKLIR